MGFDIKGHIFSAGNTRLARKQRCCYLDAPNTTEPTETARRRRTAGAPPPGQYAADGVGRGAMQPLFSDQSEQPKNGRTHTSGQTKPKRRAKLQPPPPRRAAPRYDASRPRRFAPRHAVPYRHRNVPCRASMGRKTRTGRANTAPPRDIPCVPCRATPRHATTHRNMPCHAAPRHACCDSSVPEKGIERAHPTVTPTLFLPSPTTLPSPLASSRRRQMCTSRVRYK